MDSCYKPLFNRVAATNIREERLLRLESNATDLDNGPSLLDHLQLRSPIYPFVLRQNRKRILRCTELSFRPIWISS
jgi:hypothetical protein